MPGRPANPNQPKQFVPLPMSAELDRILTEKNTHSWTTSLSVPCVDGRHAAKARGAFGCLSAASAIACATFSPLGSKRPLNSTRPAACACLSSGHFASMVGQEGPDPAKESGPHSETRRRLNAVH
jgi:hypothetical protein